MLDPFFREKFDLIDGITWADLGSGDADVLERYVSFSQPVTYAPPSVHIEDGCVSGPHGEIPIRMYVGEHAPAEGRRCLVWLHGGAWMFGDLDMIESHGVAAEIAHRWPGVVVSVDYRLAPKFPFPTALEECVAVVEHVVARSSELGVDRGVIAIGGASAGANLATATALRLRDGGGPSLRAVCLAYPALHREIPVGDAEQVAAANALPPLARFEPPLIRDIYTTYIGNGFETAGPYAFPAEADLAGLPPFAIVNSEYDDLRPSGEEFARLLQAAGVPVTTHTETGVAHGHLNYLGSVDGADATVERFLEHLSLS